MKIFTKLLNYYSAYPLPSALPDRESAGYLFTPILVALILLMMEYFGLQSSFYELAAGHGFFAESSRNDLNFFSQIYFSASSAALFVLVPLLYQIIFPAKDVLGLRFASWENWALCCILLTVMIPIVWTACGSESFNSFYPLYKPVSWQKWLLFEIVYLTQFFSAEFFFRGFALFRLERIFKENAILLMVIPYSLIHIHKPFPEAAGSILAGMALGGLALRCRSILPGAVLHISIALCADFFSLIRSGRFWMLFES